MPSDPVFLETTAIIDHFFQPEKTRIDQVLEQSPKKVSAQYVKMEIKRGFLQYLVLLHNRLSTYPTFGSVMGSIYKLSLTPLRNRLSSMLDDMKDFFQKVETPSKIDNLDEYLRKEAASYTRILIRVVWNSVDKLVDELLNPMDCFLDIISPYQDGRVIENKPRQCNNSQVECKIKQFFAVNRSEFNDVLIALKNLPNPDDETKKRITSLKNIIRLLQHPSRRFSNWQHNFKDCWNCGDAILAVIAPVKSSILTSNVKHYKPICEAIDRNVISYIG